MKFTAFKEFRYLAQNKIEDVSEYVGIDLKKILRELQLGLNKLTFQDNFNSFTETVTIPATSELSIRNKLLNEVPSYRLIVRGGDGAQNIVDGDALWDENYVSLKNTGATDVTFTVVFFR